MNDNKLPKTFTERLFSSLDTYSKGFDGRNISAMMVVTTSVAIGWLYGISLFLGRGIFDFNGVLLVGVLLFFGAVYLAIINGEQLKDIMTSKNSTTIIEKHKEEPENDNSENKDVQQ